ncbi:hypothetical protein DPMN_067822 [Dreissena polymorpha]|uniref:Uncharacterized protein n=1 Tax=Dreissena polymorpha TaxID=45954 RepID=A0A9D3YWG7_DREPO|nr:hypothetical protein DPMN_067822 [Dreissena polymorpha]
MRCLKRILEIKWQDRIPHSDIQEPAGIPNIYAIQLATGTRPSSMRHYSRNLGNSRRGSHRLTTVNTQRHRGS